MRVVRVRLRSPYDHDWRIRITRLPHGVATPEGMKIGLSDTLIGVHEITATDAARTFRELLDQVERDGESYRITRHGRIVAELHPARRGSLSELADFARANRSAHPGADEDWAADIAWVRDQSASLDDPWNQ